MFNIQFILSLFKETRAIQIIYFFMAVSIIQILDLFLSVYLTSLFGVYLIMAALCIMAIAGFFISLKRIKVIINTVKNESEKGSFPENSFHELTGVYLSAFLVFIPGFISSVAGLILMIPLLSKNSGRFISQKTSTDWHTVYEYMKI